MSKHAVHLNRIEFKRVPGNLDKLPNPKNRPAKEIDFSEVPSPREDGRCADCRNNEAVSRGGLFCRGCLGRRVLKDNPDIKFMVKDKWATGGDNWYYIYGVNNDIENMWRDYGMNEDDEWRRSYMRGFIKAIEEIIEL